MEKPDTPPSPGQPSPKQPRPLKRKRAAVACDSCRVRKLKCDNGRPVCGRCQGYDFQCTWTGQRRSDADGQTSSSPSVDQRLALVNEACADFAEETRLKVSSLLDCISACVSEQRLSMRAKDHDDTGTDAQIQSQTTRYVGELSDIHFLSLSRSRLDFSSTGSIDNSIETYDQECVKQPALPPQEFAADMPCSEECQGYLETYFSTIHIAYPFIPKSIFMKRFQSLFAQPAAKGPDEGHVTKAWLALFYTVLALGVHHRRTLDTALGDSKASLGLHATLFRKALALTDLHNLEATTVQVSALLARCFYLLATSQTDRCWVCLGVAVRLAQSLGMHVSHVESQPKQWGYGLSGLAQAEVRSRNWFCLFVLDQLLALQLGRPSITGPETFCVPLPIAIDDSTLDWNTDDLEQAEVPDQSLGDYFLHIIQFSKIVRLVVTELSIPQRSTGNKLASVASWDAQLQKWKHQLPRHLQFYVGQVFDKKMLFRRQRNMLAIKYHHIRTLIHRPFLELPCDMGTPIVGEEIEVAVRLGEICLYEARSTMHLFHNIQDVGEIVHDFPWWQIISCLLCAGTVLVVSSATDRDDTQELLSEAEACLKILEVLGGISQGARIAQNMLNKLLNRASSASTNRAVYGYGPGSADTVENGLKFPTETPQEMGRVLPLAYHQPWEQLNHGADTQWLNDPSLIWPFDSLLWSQEVLNSMNPTSAAADDVGTR